MTNVRQKKNATLLVIKKSIHLVLPIIIVKEERFAIKMNPLHLFKHGLKKLKNQSLLLILLLNHSLNHNHNKRWVWPMLSSRSTNWRSSLRSLKKKTRSTSLFTVVSILICNSNSSNCRDKSSKRPIGSNHSEVHWFYSE